MKITTKFLVDRLSDFIGLPLSSLKIEKDKVKLYNHNFLIGYLKDTDIENEQQLAKLHLNQEDLVIFWKKSLTNIQDTFFHILCDILEKREIISSKDKNSISVQVLEKDYPIIRIIHKEGFEISRGEFTCSNNRIKYVPLYVDSLYIPLENRKRIIYVLSNRTNIKVTAIKIKRIPSKQCDYTIFCFSKNRMVFSIQCDIVSNTPTFNWNTLSPIKWNAIFEEEKGSITQSVFEYTKNEMVWNAETSFESLPECRRFLVNYSNDYFFIFEATYKATITPNNILSGKWEIIEIQKGTLDINYGKEEPIFEREQEPIKQYEELLGEVIVKMSSLMDDYKEDLQNKKKKSEDSKKDKLEHIKFMKKMEGSFKISVSILLSIWLGLALHYGFAENVYPLICFIVGYWFNYKTE